MDFTNNDEDFVNKIIKSKEGIDLEFKQKVTSETKIAKTISALANANGGLIIVGISDQKRIVGIDPDEEIFMIEKANSTYCSPPAQLAFEIIKWDDPDPSPYEQSEKYLLKVEVCKSLINPIAYLSPGGQTKIFRRFGDQSRLVP